MEKLELRHIAPYLPYKLKGLFKDEDDNAKNYLSELETDNIEYFLDEATIILRPLSDLTKEIEQNFFPYDELWKYHNFSSMNFYYIEKDPTRYPYTIVSALLSWHFDVFGLIEKGLAIDINSFDNGSR